VHTNTHKWSCGGARQHTQVRAHSTSHPLPCLGRCKRAGQVKGTRKAPPLPNGPLSCLARRLHFALPQEDVTHSQQVVALIRGWRSRRKTAPPPTHTHTHNHTSMQSHTRTHKSRAGRATHESSTTCPHSPTRENALPRHPRQPPVARAPSHPRTDLRHDLGIEVEGAGQTRGGWRLEGAAPRHDCRSGELLQGQSHNLPEVLPCTPTRENVTEKVTARFPEITRSRRARTIAWVQVCGRAEVGGK
jgi:hypothetical protein